MELLSLPMWVIRRKNTNEYMRNNGYCQDINNRKYKSAIRLYKTEDMAKSAVRYHYHFEDYDFIPVNITITEL